MKFTGKILKNYAVVALLGPISDSHKTKSTDRSNIKLGLECVSVEDKGKTNFSVYFCPFLPVEGEEHYAGEKTSELIKGSKKKSIKKTVL